MSEVRRGEIWLVDFDPALGHEMKKARPAVIIQNDKGNAYSPMTIIAPITSQNIDNVYPFEVLLNEMSGLEKTSKVLLSHIRAIDKMRLIKKISKVGDDDIGKINDALKLSLGLA